MDEGVRLVGALRDWPISKLALGLRVSAEIEPLSDVFARVYFRVDDASRGPSPRSRSDPADPRH